MQRKLWLGLCPGFSFLFCLSSVISCLVWVNSSFAGYIYIFSESSCLIMSAMGLLAHDVLSICDSHLGPFLLLVSFLLSIFLWLPPPILGELNPRAKKYYRLISAGCVRKRPWRQDETWSVIFYLQRLDPCLHGPITVTEKKNNSVIFSWIQPYGTALPEPSFCFPLQTVRNAIWTSRLTTQYTNSLPNVADGFHVSKGLFINVDIFCLTYLHIAQKPAYNMGMICMHLISEE